MTFQEVLTKYNMFDSSNAGQAKFYFFSVEFTEVERSFWFDTTKTQSYINLATLLNYIQENQNLFVSNASKEKNPYLIFDIHPDNFMLSIPNHISSDPTICLVPNDKLRVFANSENSVPDIINDFSKDCPNEYIRRVMYLSINIEYLASILSELKNDKGEIILFDFLKKILDDINRCLGGINQLTYKVFDNVVRIIEEAPLKYDNLKKNTEYAKFNVYGVRPNEGSFISNINFNVTVTNDMATMITVGAQANGNQPGVNSTAFSKFNEGLIDRIMTEKTPDQNLTENSSDKDIIQEYEKTKQKYLKAVEDTYYNKKLTIEIRETLNNLNSDFTKEYVAKATNAEQIPAPFFLPFDLELGMLGLSGMKIFEKFVLTGESEKILPFYYRDNNGKSLIDFIIIDLKHSIKNNKWETVIKGRSIPSETSLEPKPVTKFTLSQEVLEAGIQATRNLTRIPRPNEGFPNANALREIIASLGYVEKGNELDNGGDITPELVVSAGAILRELKAKLNPSYYNTLVITAGNDLYHQRLGYTSTHTQGKAFDFVVKGIPPIVNQNTVLDDIVKILTPLKANGTIKVFIDEYRKPSGASTGGHFHLNI